jgi:hypothetical protein
LGDREPLIAGDELVNKIDLQECGQIDVGSELEFRYRVWKFGSLVGSSECVLFEVEIYTSKFGCTIPLIRE